jgi:hypothetical protein
MVELMIFSFVPLSMFFLGRFLTSDTISAFLAGIIFGYCPYLLASFYNGQLEKVGSLVWMPLFILFLFKSLKIPCKTNLFFLILTFLGTALSCPYNGLALCLFTLLYLCYHLLSIIKRKAFKGILPVLFIFTFSLIPVYFNYKTVSSHPDDRQVFIPASRLKIPETPNTPLSHALFTRNSKIRDQFSSIGESDLYSFYIWIGKKFVTTGEYCTLEVSYLGIIPFIIMLMFMTKRRVFKYVMFWLLSMSFFIILCLGEKLKINGWEVTLKGHPIVVLQSHWSERLHQYCLFCLRDSMG